MPMMKRFETWPLDQGAEPYEMFSYYVTGRGEFPWDMLRYDCCWPVDTDDAMNLDWRRPLTHNQTQTKYKHLRSIKMRSYQRPTIERWLSFGWSVGLEKL